MIDRKPATAGEIFDLLQESVLIQDLAGRITDWNAASERLYGWSKAEAIGRDASELLGAVGEAAETVEVILHETGFWQGEVSRATAASGSVTVRVTRHLRRDEQGAPIDVVETGIDLTAERRAEEVPRLVVHRDDYVSTAMEISFWEVDIAAVALMLKDLARSGVADIAAYCVSNRAFAREMVRATRIVDVNDRTVSLFGRGDKQELLATLEPFFPTAGCQVFADCITALCQERPSQTTKVRLRSLDGREFDTLFAACVPPDMVSSGRVLLSIIDASDVATGPVASRTGEERYRFLFDFVPAALIQLDRSELAGVFDRLKSEGVIDLERHIDAHPEFVAFALSSIKIREVNRKALQLFGATDASEIRGPATRLWSEGAETFVRSMAARFQGAGGFEAEIKIRTVDGRVRDALYVTDFPEALKYEPLGLVCLIDITDRVDARQMLARVEAEFAHAARISMLGEFTASIAHEVSQPLGAIMTNAEAAVRWLNRPVPDIAELRALSVRTIADARRAADVIHRIRAMAVPKGPEPARMALNGVVRDVMLFLSPELRRQGIEARLDLAPDLPDVIADRIQLQQVLANISINATQAMARHPRRRLTIRTRRPEPDTLLAEVEDTGPGIAPEDLVRLFDSFFTTKQGGMGIGLAICRSIIVAHGGSIEAANRPEGGARFRILLPVASDLEQARSDAAGPERGD